ncbi:MAG: response regulator [Nitrospirae bacterium]|nr:response regulator [Nitrospirota bacterium]
MSASILVIDDEESIRYTFENFLFEAGYRVVTAKDFPEAAREIGRGQFDLVITDIILGGKTGIDILRLLHEKGIVCPVVVITGYPSIETAAEAVKLSAFDYAMKPVTKDTLLNIVKKALASKKLPNK